MLSRDSSCRPMAVNPGSGTPKQEVVPTAGCKKYICDGLGKQEQNCCTLAEEFIKLFGPHLAAIC
jgi:hypothetical protein